MADQNPLFCDRCCQQLAPGRGNLYVVTIDAVADPFPPDFSEEELQRNHAEEFQRVVDQLQLYSAREAMDQVHRRVTLYLCNRCYQTWIEDPVK